MNGLLYPEIQGMLGGDQVDPKNLALLQAGLGIMAAGPGRSFGQALGMGGMQGVQAYQQAMQQERARQMQMLQMLEQKRMHDAQIKNYEANAKENEAQAEQRRSAGQLSAQQTAFLQTPEVQAALAKGDMSALTRMPGITAGDLFKYGEHLSKKDKAPMTRKIRRGDKEVTQEWRDGDYIDIAEGPAFARQVAPVVKIGMQSDTPKLKPGERWNPERGVVEIVKGSDLDRRHSANHAKDYKALQGLETKTDNALEKIDYILSDKNKDAFNANFGGYNAYLTQYKPGDSVQNMRLKIESLKSDLKNAGLELMRQGGSIGQMTLAEWPIVERAIESISPVLGEDGAREALKGVRAHLDRIRRSGRDVYNKEWQGSQYYSAPGATGDWEDL